MSKKKLLKSHLTTLLLDLGRIYFLGYLCQFGQNVMYDQLGTGET